MNTTVTDCGLHEPFLESLAGSEEESRRVAAQAGLLVLRIVDRFANRDFQTETESIQYQIAAARKFVAGEVLEPEVRDLLDETLAAAARVLTTGSTEEIFSPLIDYGRWLEGNLQLDAAIDVHDTLLAVGGTPDNHARALCWRGRTFRIAGRLDESIADYAAAGDMAIVTGNRNVQLHSRLGVAMGRKKTGNLPVAEQLARDAVQDAREWNEKHMEAIGLHVLGDCLALMDRYEEGVPQLFAAYELHGEEWEKARVMSDIGYALKRLGRYESALHAFSIALPGCDSEAWMKAGLEILEVESMRGNQDGFERWREVLGAKRSMMPPYDLIDFLTKVGQGLFLFGEVAEGVQNLEQAMHLAEANGLNTSYFVAERKLAELNEMVAVDRPGPALEKAESSYPELVEVEKQLRALDLEPA